MAPRDRDTEHHQSHDSKSDITHLPPIIETPFNIFANRVDPDQAALIRAALSESTLFAYGYMIRYDLTLVKLTSCLFSMYKRESLH